MNYYQEKIENDSLIPARIYISRGRSDKGYYPMHWHENLEFDLVLRGIIKGKINQKKVEIDAGECFFVNSGELHETEADDSRNIHTVTILLSYDLLKEYFKDIDSYYFDFNGKKSAKNRIKNLIIECADLYERNEQFYELEISIILRKICSILLKECLVKKESLGHNSCCEKSLANIKKAILYIEKNYDTDISLQSIAAEIGMAPTYFSRFFKNTTGETFYSYLSKTRLYYARMELMNSDTSITEIALNNGFSNVKAFIEVFKKVYKITPAKYKKQFYA